MSDFLKEAENWESEMIPIGSLSDSLDKEIEKISNLLLKESNNAEDAFNKLDMFVFQVKNNIKELIEQKEYDDNEQKMIAEATSKLIDNAGDKK